MHLRHALDLKPDYEPAMAALKDIENTPEASVHVYTLLIIVCLVSVCFFSFKLAHVPWTVGLAVLVTLCHLLGLDRVFDISVELLVSFVTTASILLLMIYVELWNRTLFVAHIQLCILKKKSQVFKKISPNLKYA